MNNHFLIIWISFVSILPISRESLCFAQLSDTKIELRISDNDLSFLEKITRDITDSAHIYPGKQNTTGGVVITPGGNYAAFWIRDYAMSLESGFVTREEQKHMLLLTAGTQCDQTRITKGGSMIPYGAIADHIRLDGIPIYFPGTYSYEGQGIPEFGTLPPYCDQFFFIHMAYYYVETTSDLEILNFEINGIKLIDRMETAFRVPPSSEDNHLVVATEYFRGVDFGFRDVVEITGELSLPSILKFRAAQQLALLLDKIGNSRKASDYRMIAEKIKQALPKTFSDEKGMLRASTGKSNQSDVWATALAVYFSAMDEHATIRACRALNDAYAKGTLSYKGNIRHVLTSDDYNDKTSWEKTRAAKNTYQNGAYWGTPVGWVCYAMAKTDRSLAAKLAKEFIDDLRATDYRKGPDFGAPYECFHPSGHKQNPLYLTTVACPYIVFKNYDTPKETR